MFVSAVEKNFNYDNTNNNIFYSSIHLDIGGEVYQTESVMRKHTKIYLEFFNFDELDYIPCEVCHSPAQDIHHIEARGMGGSKLKDYIGNLQAVCRPCHIKYGDKKQFKDMLVEIHLNYMEKYGKQD